MVADWKIEMVEELAEKASQANVVALVNIEGIPSKQFQRIRKSIRDVAEVKVTRNSVIRRSLEKARLKGLEDYIHGPMGIIFSDLDPFKLSRALESTRTFSPAKAGSISPKDILIPAGDTPFAPGPIIGELQKVGIKAQIKGGKIVITEDSLVVKKGERISADMANILTRMGIEPIEISFDISAAYENGIIYTKEILKIDEKKTLSDVKNAYINALNLAVNARIYNSATIRYLLRDAFSKAVNLGINADIPNKETIKTILARASSKAMALKVISETKRE